MNNGYNAPLLGTINTTRLDWKIISLFGTPDYAYEELVAEMCSCFMSVDLKAEMIPEHIENHKAYSRTGYRW